jgi:hypothetical protein
MFKLTLKVNLPTDKHTGGPDGHKVETLRRSLQTVFFTDGGRLELCYRHMHNYITGCRSVETTTCYVLDVGLNPGLPD